MRCLAACMIGIGLTANMALAEVRGLVIGIDEYRHGSSLTGAVNDARDIARALRRLGVTDLTLLLDGSATRDRIAYSWTSMAERADKDDTLVLTYAGHGSQEPERVAGTELDGRDEVLLLGGFEEGGPGSRERIIDNEFNHWFKEAGRRGLRVLFVADSCHSGTLTRSFDSRAGEPGIRYASYEIDDDMLTIDLPPEAALNEDALPHVTFLAAGQESQKIPEIELMDSAGRRSTRGALSWVFARALEGEGDANGDGQLTRGELNRFVRENVRVLAEARQTPNLLPKGDDAYVVLALSGSAPTVTEVPMPELPAARLRIAGLDAATTDMLVESLSNVTLANATDGADLIYDATSKQVISGQGDVVAHDVARTDLQGVVDKWATLALLKVDHMGQRLTMRIVPDDATHGAGKIIGFRIDGIALPYLTIFSLSGDGTLHFHYPLAGDPATVSPGQPVRYDFRVEPPFGADHIFTIASDDPMAGLVNGLETLDGRRAATEALRAVLAATRNGRHQIGIQGLYTAP